MYSDIPMFIMDNYHHPNKLKKVTVDNLAKKMEKENYRQYDYCIYEAHKIKKYLDNCVSGCSELDIVCLSFVMSVHMLKEQIKLVDKSLDSLITLAKQTPYFLILKSYPV
jgi:hypothetical protein